MKTKVIAIIIILIVLGISGAKVYENVTKEEPPKEVVSTPVKTVSITTSVLEDVLKYEGRVTPNRIEKISFKSTARLLSLEGEIGDLISAETLLASLDTSDMEFALEGANNQYLAANAEYQRAVKGARSEDVELAYLNVQKASQAVSYLTTKIEDITNLYNEGIVSQSELEGLQLELDLANSDLSLATKNYEKATNGTEVELINAARAQLGLAKVNLDVQQALIEDATFTLSEDMVLIETFYESGELVPAGYPVAVLRSVEQGVILGVSGKDLDEVYIGQEVTISGLRFDSKGKVVRIAEIPDQSHFLYEVEVALDRDDFKVGEIVQCSLSLKKIEVILVPISAIMNDGIDYVFVARDGVATIQKVNIIETLEGDAIITGLNVGDQLIISNLNRIHEQSKIHIEE